MTARRRNWLVIAGVLLAIFVYSGFISRPSGPQDVRIFDPDRTAELEISMWKAYYDKRNVALFMDLITATRERYRCSRFTAARIAFHLARAAATFGNLRSDYDQVLPDLEKGYGLAREVAGLTYDPASLAKAELAWWVARRIPGKNSAEQVGDLIADLNAQFYNVPKAKVLEASVLRARAGKLRDDGGLNADWPEISRILVESYRSLHAGVN